jgi:hypothetical protein
LRYYIEIFLENFLVTFSSGQMLKVNLCTVQDRAGRFPLGISFAVSPTFSSNDILAGLALVVVSEDNRGAEEPNDSSDRRNEALFKAVDPEVEMPE